MTNGKFLGIALASVLVLGGSGCGSKSGPSTDSPRASETAEDGEHRHDGWWCAEHGVPEAECALCDSELAAKFQAKGDWCDSHERPKSQCFECEPELEKKFIAKYEVKFGKKPPLR